MKTLVLAGSAAIAALALAGSAQAAQGLSGRYFNYSGNSVDLSETYAAANTPFATFIANEVCFPDCSFQNSIGDNANLSQFLGVAGGHASNLSADQAGVGNHTVVLDGFLNIAAGGLYNFRLSSDDGSFLRIDGVNVITNDGDHGPSNVSGFANLGAGFHTIRILQYENGGGTNLQVQYALGTDNYQALGGGVLSTTGGGDAVPEPASWALMILGFGAAGAAIRRRRTAASAA